MKIAIFLCVVLTLMAISGLGGSDPVNVLEFLPQKNFPDDFALIHANPSCAFLTNIFFFITTGKTK
jgi:hypothetical protein